MKKALVLMMAAALAATSAFAQAGGGAAGGGAAGGGTAGGGPAGGGAGGGASGGGTAGGTTGGVGGGTSGGVGTGTSRVPTNNGTQGNTAQQPSALDFPRTIFLSGKVMMDDGSPVPPNVTIQRLCTGTPQSVAYTDSKGHFSFQWGQSNGMMMDASQSSIGGFGGLGNRGSSGSMGGSSSGPSMAGCELRADLAGYRSDLVNLFNRQQMDNPDIGIIVLHRMGNVEGVSISATTLNAPKDAKKAYEKGLQLVLKNKPEDALKEFDKAVVAYPKFADAWVNIGRIRLTQKDEAGGREAFLKAIEADGKLVLPHIELGMMAARGNKWEEAAPYLAKGLKLDPVDYPLAWYASAAANFNLKKFDVAEKSAREAIKLDPKHRNPRSEYLLGLILAEKHEYSDAAEQLKSYLKFSPNATDLDTVKDQIGQIEKFLKETDAVKQP